METCPQCGRASVTEGVCMFGCNGAEPTADQRLLALEIKVEILERTIQEFIYPDQIKQ